MTLGEKIRNLRNEKDLTQEDFKKILNIKNRSTLASWETDQSSPDYETLKKIAIFFGVTTDYLLGLVDDKGERANVSFGLIDGTTVEDLEEMLGQLEVDEQKQIIDMLKGLKARAELKKQLKEGK